MYTTKKLIIPLIFMSHNDWNRMWLFSKPAAETFPASNSTLNFHQTTAVNCMYEEFLISPTMVCGIKALMWEPLGLSKHPQD